MSKVDNVERVVYEEFKAKLEELITHTKSITKHTHIPLQLTIPTPSLVTDILMDCSAPSPLLFATARASATERCEARARFAGSRPMTVYGINASVTGSN